MEVLQVKKLVKKQNDWRKNCINLIASENVLSPLAQKLLVSDFLSRYNEHGIKDEKFFEHYQGTKFSSEIEKLCIKIFSKKFKTPYVDVRPISGVLANLAVFWATLNSKDTIFVPGLTFGGHISSTKYGALGIFNLNIVEMPFDKKKLQIDVSKTIELIKKFNPKLILFGRSMFLFPEPIKEIKKHTRAIVVYDAAHVFGLIFSGFFQDPFKEGVDIITASTHKTFPGPQGGIILANPKIDKNIWKKIQYKIFPGLVSNHHIFRLPSLAITALEMEKFGRLYAKKTIENAQFLAKALHNFGFDVLGKNLNFTKSHQIILNVKNFGGGEVVAKKLERANIILNKMALFDDSPYDATHNPSGIRIGVQEMTRYGMGKNEMKKIATFIKRILIDKENPEKVKKEVVAFRKKFQKIKFCFND
jgi:glycine hydroxymethyltransferase